MFNRTSLKRDTYATFPPPLNPPRNPPQNSPLKPPLNPAAYLKPNPSGARVPSGFRHYGSGDGAFCQGSVRELGATSGCGGVEGRWTSQVTVNGWLPSVFPLNHPKSQTG